MTEVRSLRDNLRSIRAHPLLFTLLLVFVVNAFLGFFWVINFIAADSPSVALAKYGIVMPLGWEAGVMNHGKYFEWYLISNHPYAFAGSVLWLLGSVGGSAWVQRKIT